MRIKVFIKLLKEDIKIPPNSRQSINHLIKTALEKSNLLLKEELYNNNINSIKPFTFSVYFPFDSENKLKKNTFSIIFSSNDYEFLISLYNGLRNISKNFDLFKSKSEIENFTLLPQRKIDKNKITFKTLSPFLIRDIKDGNKYIYPQQAKVLTKNVNNIWPYWENKSDSDFRDYLKLNMYSLIKNIFGEDNNKESIDIESYNLSVVPVKHGSNNRDHSYEMTFPGLKGTITLKGVPDFLQLFYDIGIGARRSEGFGMLEVVE